MNQQMAEARRHLIFNAWINFASQIDKFCNLFGQLVVESNTVVNTIRCRHNIIKRKAADFLLV